MKSDAQKILGNYILKSVMFLTLVISVFSAFPSVLAFDDDWSEEVYTAYETEKTSVAESQNIINFFNVLNQKLIKRGWKKEEICSAKDVVINRVMREYGSIFVVADHAAPPPVCMFTNQDEVANFQQKVGFVSQEIAGTRIELQPAAMEALQKARGEAQQIGLDITPRDGAEAGRRNYADTVRLWKSRFEPACDHWLKEGRLTIEQIEKLKTLSVKEQVAEVLLLEKQGIYFNKFFNNSILYSVAPPGTSQHLSMLALDVNEYDNPQVREILARYGWFQTVKNDQPHFTFLGHERKNLNSVGLREATTRSGKFWIPNV